MRICAGIHWGRTYSAVLTNVRNMSYILTMGFKEIRRLAIQAIQEGRVQHEARGGVDEKNLLLVGDVTIDQVVRLLSACRGTQYSSSPHHTVHDIVVHVFKPEVNVGLKKERWYIKLYILEPDVWFISVHQSTKAKC